MTLRTELVAFVAFLRSTLTLPQIAALCQFVGTSLSAQLFQAQELFSALNSVSDDVLETVIQGTTGDENSVEQFRATLEMYANSLQVVPDVVSAFGPLFKMYGLVDLLRKVNVLQLMKLHEVLSQSPGQEVNILQQLQQLFPSVDPMTFQVVHGEISQRRQDPLQLLQNHLNLPMDRFFIYKPLELFMTLPLEELNSLVQIFPSLQPLQLYQLADLLKLPPFDVLEMRRTLVPDNEEIPVDLDFLAPIVGLDQPWVQQPAQVPNYPLRVKIVEQPPEQCIYRRNVKPNPVLMLVGDESLNDGNLYVTCTVVRCDEMVPEAKFITGNAPVQVARKLKIMVTSHQQNETLFLLKFDLVRRTPHNPEGEVLHTTFSNPITVLSHSTQLRPAASSVPVIREIIPISGPTSGGTRVAVLGSNFNDGPGTRVRFDNIDVIPTYHGGGTLICHTPTHAPGLVQVTACNDPRRWSDTAAGYTYESPSSAMTEVKSSIGLSEKFGLGIAETVQEAAWEGGYDQLKGVLENNPGINELDGFGYASLHYAAAHGWVEASVILIQAGAAVDRPDKLGNSALHWAVAHSHYELVQKLLCLQAPVDQQNLLGATPLHAAVAAGDEALARLLLDNGANPNMEDVSCCTPLHWAAVRCTAAMVSLLLLFGAWIDPQDEMEETPLFWALREENFAVAQSLVQYGAAINACNDDAETVLHLVSSMGDKFIVEKLLEAGAAAQVTDALGATPADDAATAGHVDLAPLLAHKLYKAEPPAVREPAWPMYAFPVTV